MRIGQITQDYELEYRWKMFPLHPETPLQGRSLEDLFAHSTVNVSAMLKHLTLTAKQLGLPFGARTMTYNSRMAQELGMWVESIHNKQAKTFHMEVFLAYFRDGNNIGEAETLLSIADKCSLPLDEARHVLAERTFRNAIDIEWKKAKDLRVTAVPTLVINNYSLTGFQPYEQIQQLLNQAGVNRKK